jgi:hypothetical protein
VLVDQLLIDVCSILGALLDSLQCRGRGERRGGERRRMRDKRWRRQNRRGGQDRDKKIAQGRIVYST